MPNGRENTISQMKELIVQNFNHPSIICWGLSNEISVTGVTDDLMENHKILNDLAHKMDHTRPTTMAHAFMLEIDEPLVFLPDVMSYNLYYGWYLGNVTDSDG
jgi:beta-galactosidase